MQSPPPGLATALLPQRVPQFRRSLVVARRLAAFDPRDEITLLFLDDAELAAGGASLRVVVVKHDAVAELSEVRVGPAGGGPGEDAGHPAAVDASELVPLGNAGPIRALKLAPRDASPPNLQSGPAPPPALPRFLAVLRSAKAVELSALDAGPGQAPRRIQETGRDRRNAEGIVGIEWVGTGDLLVVGSGGIEGWRFAPQTGLFALKKSVQVPVSWYLYSPAPRLLLVSSTAQPAHLLLYHVPPGSLTLQSLPPLRFPSDGQGVFLRPMRREFAVVQAYGCVFVCHVQGTRLTIHRITASGCVVQGIHDLSAADYLGGSQFVAGPVVDEGLLCVHELVGRTTMLVDVKWGIVGITRIEVGRDGDDDAGAEEDEPQADIYPSLADPSASHASTTSPSALARHPFLLSTLTGTLYRLVLNPIPLFESLFPDPDPDSTPRFTPLEAARFLLTKPTIPHQPLVLSLLRTLVARRTGPEAVRAVVAAVLPPAAGAREAKHLRAADKAAPEDLAAEMQDALGEAMFSPGSAAQDEDEGRSISARSEESRAGTPGESRAGTPSKRRAWGRGRGREQIYEGTLRAEGEAEIGEADVVAGLGDAASEDGPSGSYEMSLLVQLLPQLPSLAPILVSKLLDRGELHRLEQLVRNAVIPPTKDILGIISHRLAQHLPDPSPPPPDAPDALELAVDRTALLARERDRSHRLLLSIHLALARRAGLAEFEAALLPHDPVRAARAAESRGAIPRQARPSAFMAAAQARGDALGMWYLWRHFMDRGYAAAAGEREAEVMRVYGDYMRRAW